MFRVKSKEDIKAIWEAIKVLQESGKSVEKIKEDISGMNAEIKGISSTLTYQDRLLDKQEKINESNWKSLMIKIDELDKRFSNIFEIYDLKKKD